MQVDEPRTDDEELHSDASTSSSSSSNASRKERKRTRLANTSSRHNASEQSTANTLTGARAYDDGGGVCVHAHAQYKCAVWLADRLPDTHNFDKIAHDHHVLLLVTGSVAAIKMQPVLTRLCTNECSHTVDRKIVCRTRSGLFERRRRQ